MPAASDAATVPTVAASMPATTADPSATAMLRSFEGRDANHDGFVSHAENGAAEAKIFNAIDSNQDGAMTVPELDAARVALGLVTLPGSDALIADADQDGDKKLTLAEWIACAQLHVFGQCGHWTQIEHAERFARLVENFLAEADALHC